MHSTVNSQTEIALLSVMVQVIVVIAVARCVGYLFRYLGQPQVCGEIAGGLLLGPSFLGGFFPHVFTRIFNPSEAPVIAVLSQMGLVLLMFAMGLEFDFGHLRGNGFKAFSISTAGIVFPFGFGLLIGHVLYSQLGLTVNEFGFCLFIGTAMSITAIPVLGRIMIELNINRTRLGCLTISAAALNDVTGWILLALVSAVVRAKFQPWNTVVMILETAGFGLFMLLVVRPLLIRWSRSVLRHGKGEISASALTIMLILMFVCAAITNLIGIFSVFGAFMTGAILHDQHEFRAAVFRRMYDFITVFFLPIFFTYTGLRTDIGSMQGVQLWALCGLVLLTAFAGKFGGCAAASLLAGLNWREASLVGIMMNTRGLVELVVINVGFDLGVIPKNVFFMLVVMAVITTYMTTPILRLLSKQTELEPYIQKSVFVKP